MGNTTTQKLNDWEFTKDTREAKWGGGRHLGASDLSDLISKSSAFGLADVTIKAADKMDQLFILKEFGLVSEYSYNHPSLIEQEGVQSIFKPVLVKDYFLKDSKCDFTCFDADSKAVLSSSSGSSSQGTSTSSFLSSITDSKYCKEMLATTSISLPSSSSSLTTSTSATKITLAEIALDYFGKMLASLKVDSTSTSLRIHMDGDLSHFSTKHQAIFVDLYRYCLRRRVEEVMQLACLRGADKSVKEAFAAMSEAKMSFEKGSVVAVISALAFPWYAWVLLILGGMCLAAYLASLLSDVVILEDANGNVIARVNFFQKACNIM